jgi:hypothetical protein
MALGEGDGHPLLGVDPADGHDHEVRVVSELSRSLVDFGRGDGRLVVSLISGSCLLAMTLPVLETPIVLGVPGLVFFLASITTPSSKDPSSSLSSL